jgi:hypothetical protein
MPARPPGGRGTPPPGAGQQWRLSGNAVSGSNFLGSTNRQPLSIRTNNEERVRITAAGRVGVATSTPQTALHVIGGRARLESDGKRLDLRADGGHVDVQSTTSKLYLHSSGPEGRNQVLINPQRNQGNVGIGTTDPQTKLHIFGDRVRLESSGKQIDMRTDGNNVDVESTTSNLFLHSRGPQGRNQVIINPFAGEGNVGIGTQSPQRKLHVDGEIMANDVVLSSDVRFKADITRISEAGRRIAGLRGVEFTRTHERDGEDHVSRRSAGVIAQEVEAVFPELVSTGDDDNDPKAVNYAGLTGLLIEAVKELQAENRSLRSRLVKLEQALGMPPASVPAG